VDAQYACPSELDNLRMPCHHCHPAPREAVMAGRATMIVQSGLRRCGRTALGIVIAATVATGANAAKAGWGYQDIDGAKYGEKPFQNPPEIHARNGALQTRLAVRYTNPSQISIGGCGVKLRTYNGQLIGPTLHLKAGEALDILLDNQLPAETPDEVNR